MHYILQSSSSYLIKAYLYQMKVFVTDLIFALAHFKVIGCMKLNEIPSV